MSNPFLAGDFDAPAANTAAVVTYAAVAGNRHVIAGVRWSYDGVPTGGNLQIEDGSGNVVESFDITSGGPGYLPMDGHGSINTALIITLAAGGAGVTGKLKVEGHAIRPY